MDTATHDATGTLYDQPGEATRRGQDADRQIGQALRRHTGSLLPALVNRQERLLVREHVAAELALGFEHRRVALGMVLESRLQAVREACNHVLVVGKTHLRQQRIDHFGQVYRQLESRMQDLADGFLAEADARYARLERIASEHLRARERARQEKAAMDFLDTIDCLMDEFRAILSENVQARSRDVHYTD
jgi:hypothetical protein